MQHTKISTFSVVVGDKTCNAKCPFCVSKMTYDVVHGSRYVNPKGNRRAWRNFGKACKLASRQGVVTAMITGKGEPTLFPQEVSDYVEQLDAHGFPFIELQTNGLRLVGNDLDDYLQDWWDKGMTHIALSVVGWQNEANHQIYCPHWKQGPDYEALISKLHGYNFTVRLCCILAKGSYSHCG